MSPGVPGRYSPGSTLLPFFSVGLSLEIDGKEYSWEKNGHGTTCVIDPSLCPLPLNQVAHGINIYPTFWYSIFRSSLL